MQAIKPEYREEMVGALSTLADMVRSGRLTPKQFLSAQKRIIDAYTLASE